MATYGPAGTEVQATLDRVIDRFYPELQECHARIGLVLAYPSVGLDNKDSGPAMKVRGHQAFGKVKINNEADRIAGAPDATLTIDAAHWKDLGEEGLDGDRKREALLDGLLYFLEARIDNDTGRIKTDDRGRPLFRKRTTDWELSGFRAVAARHRQFAPEVIEARRFHDSYGNYLFAFADDLASGSDYPLIDEPDSALIESNRDTAEDEDVVDDRAIAARAEEAEEEPSPAKGKRKPKRGGKPESVIPKRQPKRTDLQVVNPGA